MKNFINIMLLSVMLSGCAVVQKYWPRDHDPALASAYVTTKLSSNKLGCGDKKNFETWDAVIFKAEWLDEYAKFRGDPQQESTASIVENLNKAKSTSSERACEIWLDLVKQRLIVLNKAWSGR